MQGSPRIDELRQKFHENPRRYFAPLANEYRKAGDPEQAIAICRAHLAQQPGHMSGHVVYAQSLYDAGRVDESRVVFEKALSLDPDNAIVLRYLGDISRQRGDSSEALHWYSRALEADPHDSQVAAYVAELTEPLTESPEVASEPKAEPVEGAPAVAEAEAPVTDATVEPEPEKREQSAPEPVVETSSEQATVESQPAAVETEPVAAESEPAHVESAHESDAEVEMPEPAQEPEVVAAAESPFVTRTMAELYATQGHRSAALDIYRQLAAISPGDADVANRIQELSSSEPHAEAAEAATTESPVESTAEPIHDEAPAQGDQIPTMAPVEFADFAPSEPEPANEFAELTDFEADLTFHSENEPAVPADSESDQSSAAHFTDGEIGESHKWDESAWGEGFSSSDMEMEPYDFSPSELAFEDEPPAAEPSNTSSTAEAEPVAEVRPADEEPVTSVEHPPAEDATETLEIAEHGSTPVPLGVLNDAHEDIAPEDLAVSTEGASAADDTRADEEPHDEETLVAYSPQAPDEDELAHYEPQGPTIREFFATLGARRPPTNGSHESFTAHAAVPGVDAIDDLPLASDAFSNLFADSPVSEDDSKAAFALSGAMSAHPVAPEAVKPRATPQSSAAPVQAPVPEITAQHGLPLATQESEEDIRRFREWLDGLADA